MLQALLPLLFLANFAQALPRIHNHSMEFVKFWNLVKNLPVELQIQEFDRQIYPTFPEFYDHRFKSWKESGKDRDEELKEAFQEFKQIQNAYTEKAAAVGAEIEQNLRSFEQRFPDFKTDFDVYIIHSLDEMDGGTRTINGKFYFIFGVESIVKYHNAATDVPFYHHELFHVYHRQFFQGEPNSLWRSLWIEGLATYAAEVLSPGSTLRDLMLDIPKGLSQSCERDMEFLWNDLRANFDSEDEAIYENYFYMSSTHTRIPRRAGYYLGYLVAKKLAKKHSLNALVKMDQAKVRRLIEQAISSRGWKR